MHGVDPARAVGWPERPHSEVSQPLVLGVVEADEGGRYPCRLVRHDVRHGAVTRIRANPRIVQQRSDLMVGAHHIAAVVLADYALFARLSAGGVGACEGGG